ncbi:MAG: VanW family protein [Selenomonadaceae bacterium]|nr:VanW family protein [Selenomonadaceae bacterium]
METTEVEKFNLKNFLSKKVSMTLAASIAAVGVGTLAFSNYMADSDKIVPGISFEGQAINGLNKRDADKIIMNIAAQKVHKLTFRYEGTEFEVTPEEINLKPLVEKAEQEAFGYGRGGSALDNFNNQIKCMLNGRDVKLSAEYDSTLLDEKLADIAAQINRDPVNAFVEFTSGGAIEKTPAVIGKKLNTEQIAESLREPLTSLNLPKGVIELVPEDIMPFVTTEDIAEIDSVIGTYSTYYYPGDRGDNIWLAANAISHKLVKSSWTFSFNDTVGERTWDAGYKVAGVIINGRPAEDYGGGVCQVSSTLYNAVLLAGLTPTERTPHFYQSTYVAPGRDATVADGYLDFKFRNDFPHNVYLIAEAYGSTLSVYVLGTKADLGGANIAIEREGSDMSPSIYRVWYSGNEVIKSEFLHTDVYETPKPRQD